MDEITAHTADAVSISIVVGLGFTALVTWIWYLIIRTAVKNGMIRAHEELDRRSAERVAASPTANLRVRDVDPRGLR